MEMVWASLWYTGLFSEQVRLPWWSIWLIFWAILALSYAIRLVMLTIKRRQPFFQVGFLIWALVAGIISLKLIFYYHVQIGWKAFLLSPWYALTGAEESFLPFFHILLVPLLIIRGIALANSIPEIRSAQIDFQTGLVGVLLFGLFYLPVQPNLSVTGLFLYLWLGLIVLSSARLYGVSAFRGGRVSAIDSAWVIGLVISAGLVILLGILSGIFFSSYIGKFLLQIFIVLIAILGGLLILLIFPLLIGIMRLLLMVFEIFGARMSDVQNAIQKALEQTQTFSVELIESQLKTFEALKIALPLLLLFVVLMAILVWLRQKNRSQTLVAEEDIQHEKPVLRLFSFNQRHRIKENKISPKQWLAVARIRRIYHQFEALCEQAGKPRHPSTTPSEFAEHAGNWFPHLKTEIDLITRTYVQVRYGEISETPDEWQTVLNAWKNVQHSLKRKKPARKQA
ncbi:DUF4129 domain-containing protein [Anaerolinea thermophila]|nr:DUF4129 domain-containing protein [Anaerolinea thermophila]